jgi:hypothetical protein
MERGVTLREEHELLVLENSMLTRIYGPKEYEVSNLGYYMMRNLFIKVTSYC